MLRVRGPQQRFLRAPRGPQEGAVCFAGVCLGLKFSNFVTAWSSLVLFEK